jgi:hypothetical protein
MTTAILFKKHRAGEISKEKFLYEVRRDQQLPFITNMTSYEDAIKILKNKSIVKEASAQDNIHPYALKKGTEAELLKGGELTNLAYAKAVATATKKLAKDPTAYDDLQMSNSAKIKKADARLGMTPVKEGNFVDKHNGMKKVKGFNDAKSNTKASKKENKRGNPKGVKMMKESALNEDLQTTFYDDIKDGKLEIAGMYVVDVQEDKVSVFFRLADQPLQTGQKLADIQKATATYNKESGEFSISGETKTKSPIVNDPESKKTFNYIKGKIGTGLQESLNILKQLLSKKKVELTEDMHPTYGMGQEVPLPEEDAKQFKSQTGIVKDIFGGTLELEIQREGEEPLIINRQVNVIDKAKELVNIKSQADDKASRDKAWSDWEERGEKTFGGVADFPSKIDADRKKKTMGIVEKLRKALGLDKKKTDEATKFKAGGEVIFTPDNMAQDKEKELQKAGVKFTKTKVA